MDLPAVDRAIDRGAERAFAFLERLIAAESTVGREGPAQRVVADELASMGFRMRRVAVPASIGGDDVAGVPQGSYRARSNVLGRFGPRRGRSLLLNGHIDVVPAATPELWSSPPFAPRRRRGWMFGRGAGDMKGGFAMATLAVGALLETAPRAIRGPLSFLSVIEEECTGNGTLAAGRAGVLADAVILPEPTDLEILVAGIGILWVEIEVVGRAAHAESADRAVNPIDEAILVIEALRDLEREMSQRSLERSMREVPHPYNVNVGVIQAGDWLSSVPPVARLGVRVGFPTTWGPAKAEERVRRAVARAARRDPWLRTHPPIVRPTGFRAEGHALDPGHPLVDAVATAHEAAHGSRPQAIGLGSTTDARFYLNQFDTPALSYGPRVRNIHGVDEAVELQSIVDGARTMARFLIDWYADGATG